MDKLDLAKQLLEQVNMPTKQQSTLCCLALLAMAKLKKDTPCSQATNDWVRIHDIIAFIGENYGVIYAENSRETFRKQAMHPFRTAALIEDNGKATNSPNYRYRITNEFLKVIQDMNENEGCLCEENASLSLFLTRHDSLSNIYASKKKMQKMPVKINNKDFTFSPGKHNQLQKAIIEEFAPRFAPNSECLYVGDTIQKDMVKDVDKLSQLGFEITLHDKMPDVVLYREDKNWITRSVKESVYFKRGIALNGYHFDFSDVLKRYFVKQHGFICEYYAIDKTALRSILYGRIDDIVELN